MSTTVINVLKVGVVVVIYLFLFVVARSVRAQVAPASAPTTRKDPAPRAPVLVVVAPDSSAGKDFEVRRTLVIGRSEASDLAIEDGFASDRHARFDNEGGVLFVDDLGSTNGTWVNGERIAGRTRVDSGDTVRIGGTIMEAR